MPSASSRMQMPRYKTEPLNLQALPQREQGSVATVRIVDVGAPKRAARSGATWQIPGPVPPGGGPTGPERPQVIYARPVRMNARGATDNTANLSFAEALDTASRVFAAPRQRMAELQMRATRALSGLQDEASTQRIVTGTWSKPSTRVMCIAVGVYALVLFLLAILSR